MFIVHLKDGRTIIEETVVWDEIPDGITSLQLTLPYRRRIQLEDGSWKDFPRPTISIQGYDRYYFGNEAISVFATADGIIRGEQEGMKTAQIIGGIDDKLGIVFQIRVDRNGNIQTNRFPIGSLQIAEHAIRRGIR